MSRSRLIPFHNSASFSLMVFRLIHAFELCYFVFQQFRLFKCGLCFNLDAAHDGMRLPHCPPPMTNVLLSFTFLHRSACFVRFLTTLCSPVAAPLLLAQFCLCLFRICNISLFLAPLSRPVLYTQRERERD
jgi:hypothetical protein